MTCTNRTLGRRPTCSTDLTASVEAIHNIIGGFSGLVFFVDPNHNNASDSHVGTNLDQPLRTVQAAIDKCRHHTGDVVVVLQNGAWQYAPGTHRTTPISEEVTLNKAGVRLVGVATGGLGVLWTPASDGGTCITITAIDCCVEGFVFDEGSYSGCDAIFADYDGLTRYADNIIIRNCQFTDTVDTAINLEFTWYCKIYNNWFMKCDEYGIYSDPLENAPDYSEIYNNWFFDCAGGAITLSELDYGNIHHNHIYNSDAEAGNLATNEGINTSGGNYNLVHNNVMSCLLPAAANGDYNDLNSGAATDAWIANQCLDGPSVTTPT